MGIRLFARAIGFTGLLILVGTPQSFAGEDRLTGAQITEHFWGLASTRERNSGIIWWITSQTARWWVPIGMRVTVAGGGFPSPVRLQTCGRRWDSESPLGAGLRPRRTADRKVSICRLGRPSVGFGAWTGVHRTTCGRWKPDKARDKAVRTPLTLNTPSASSRR